MSCVYKLDFLASLADDNDSFTTPVIFRSNVGSFALEG